MRRREFISLLGGAAALGPLAARAQGGMPAIGYLAASASGDVVDVARLKAFRHGLEELGYAAGRNVTIEFRYADGRYDRLPQMARDLIGRPVTMIFASALPAALAAKAATTAIPIVFVSGADPVQIGLVASLNRPGANITGVSNYFGALGGKRMELLRELAPKAGPIAYLLNPNNQNAASHSSEVQAAAQTMGQFIEVFRVRDDKEIDAAFSTFTGRGIVAVLVGDDPFFNTRSAQLIRLAGRHALPAIYYVRSFVEQGGLISYGSSQSETYRQGGIYAGRVLKGEKPADLPVVLPTKFELAINLKTAKALGLVVPPTLLARADEVIE